MSYLQKAEERFLIEELYSLGWSQGRIGDKVGVSGATICRWMKSWGIGPKQCLAPRGLNWPNNFQIQKFWDLVEKNSDLEICWIWKGKLTDDGYGRFCLAEKITNSRNRAHRFSFAVETGRAIPKGKFVLHSCDNPPCVNPAHLRLGNHQDNVDDKVSRNRQYFTKSKLTDEEVKEIRLRLSSGDHQKDLAEAFGVGQTSISRIKRGEYRPASQKLKF